MYNQRSPQTNVPAILGDAVCGSSGLHIASWSSISATSCSPLFTGITIVWWRNQAGNPCLGGRARWRSELSASAKRFAPTAVKPSSGLCSQFSF